MVVDVRQTPQSRKAGLSKRKLSEALEGIGVSYRHMPELGNPKDNREAFRLGFPSAVERFRELLGGEPAIAALRELLLLIDNETVMLLCYERDATSCHRSLIVDELKRASPQIVARHVESE